MTDNAPKRAGSVLGSLPFMRNAPEGFVRGLNARISAERAANAARRERVLRHPEARRMLCELFGYERAEQWNGRVPPAADSQGDIEIDPTWQPGMPPERRIIESLDVHANDSPFRKGTIAILRRVEELEQQGEAENNDGADPVSQA